MQSENAFQGLRPRSTVVSDEPARVLFLTAHPDDEVMFFAPTILSLQLDKPSAKDKEGTSRHALAYSLCLSTGDADGLGAVRVKELENSLDILSIPKGRRWLVDDWCVHRHSP